MRQQNSWKGKNAVRNDKIIVVGDLVDLAPKDGGAPFRTKIEDRTENGVLLVNLPGSGRLDAIIHPDDILALTYYRETGRYTAQVKVEGFARDKGIRYMMLTQVSEPVRDQRRMYFRLPVSLDVTMYAYTERVEKKVSVREEIDKAKAIALETAGTKDISITGIAVLSKNEYKTGSKFILDIFFKENHQGKEAPFTIFAEVMRTDYELRKNMYRLGMHFFGQSQKMSEFLARYVLKNQQKQIKQQRLIEG